VSNKVNISLTSKGQPTINLQIGDGAKKIIESEAAAPIISFVATGSKGEQGAPGTALLGDNSVTATQIADGTITSTQIQNFTISSNDIGAQQITSAKLGTNAVTTDKINADAVTSAKIADNSIGANHIVDGTIVKELITDLALTGDKIANGSISTIKLANDSVNASKIASKTITGAELADNLSLTGLTRVIRLTVDGQSPGYIDGPDNDLLYVRSNKDLIFVVDADQSSQADTSFFKFQNVSGTNLFTISETGEAVVTGSLSVNGNITVTGTVDGIDINTALSVVQSNLTKISYLTVTQPVDLDAMETKLNAISDNEVIDWTTDQGSTNIHAGNYTDTNTQLSAEEVQDIVGAMLTGNTETRITATYDDSDGTIDLVVDDMTADTNTQLTNEQVQDIVGAMVDGGTETNIAVTYDDTSGKLNFVSTDTNTTYSEATSSAEGLMSTAHHDKLDGIEAGATADQTKSDINGLAITTVGTIGTGVWQGTAIASNYLDSDTAHLSGVQTFLGPRTFAAGIIYDGDRSATPGDGAAIHVDSSDITDNNTSASGTANLFAVVNIESARVLASNASVTTTNACTLYIKSAPVAATNQTFTNSYALYIAAGTSYFGAPIEVNAASSNVAISCESTDADCMVRVQDNSTAATNAIGMVATGDDLVMRNDEGNFKVKVANNATDALIVDQSGNLTVTGAITGSTIELGHASDTTIARSAAGTVTIEGKEIITKNKVLNIHSYAYHYSGTSGHYIPMSGATTADSTSLSSSSYHLMQVMPFDGRVVRIAVYNQTTTSRTDTFEMYINGDDSDLAGDQRGTDLSFTSARSGSGDCASDWTFSKEESIAIRRTPSQATNGTTVTVVFEFDMTT